MKKSWLKTLLTKKSANPRIAELEQELADTKLLLSNSKRSESLISQRVGRLRQAYPEIYQKFFTKKGLKNEL